MKVNIFFFSLRKLKKKSHIEWGCPKETCKKSADPSPTSKIEALQPSPLQKVNLSSYGWLLLLTYCVDRTPGLYRAHWLPLHKGQHWALSHRARCANWLMQITVGDPTQSTAGHACPPRTTPFIWGEDRLTEAQVSQIALQRRLSER